ncbi:hypothetical protein N7454_004948 [Penicillium verhagenii]|nr:hypothetical protein N7454_004948 [Penicillium verhagenii]
MVDKANLFKGVHYYKELEAIAKFSHKKYEGLFVDFLGWYENDKSVFIAMEYMEYGDLDCHLNGPLPENEAREITMQIAEGLKFLHENGFAHRDIKPANIFVFQIIPDWWVKIGDFGFSKRIDQNHGLQTCVGTLVFSAPELHMFSLYSGKIVNDETELQYTEKVDMWALGVIVFYMVFHTYPFPHNKPFSLPAYMRGADLSFPIPPMSVISKDCKNFIKAALSRDASKRLSAQEAMENAWLRRSDSPLSELADMKQTEAKVTSTKEPQKTAKTPQKPAAKISNDVNQPIAGGNPQLHARNILESSTQTAVLPSRATLFNLSFSFAGGSPVHFDPEKLQALHTQGVQFYRDNDFEKAELMLGQAADGRKKVLGLSHRDTRNSCHCLAVLYYHMTKYSMAKKIFQSLLGAQQTVYGPHGISTLKSRYWIGVLMCREGEHKEGLAMLQDVAEIQERVLGLSHPDTVLSLSATEQEKPPQILQPQPQMCISQKILKVEKATNSMQESIWKLAPLLRRANATPHPFEGGRVKTKWVNRGRENSIIVLLLPESSPHLLRKPKPDESELSKTIAYYRTMSELGQRLHGKGQYDAAQFRLQTAVIGLKDSLGPTHTDSLDASYWLGRNEYELRHYETAEGLFREVASGLTETLGKSDRKTLNCFRAIGLALSKQENHNEAMPYFESALEGLVPISDAHDQDLVHVLFQIGYSLYKQGKFEKAERILQDVLERRDVLPGPMAEDTIECVYWLGRALFDLERYHEAEEAFRRTFTRRRKNTDISSNYWLGLAMYHQEKYEQATPFLHRAFSLRNTRHGEHDLDTLCSSYWLGLSHIKNSRYTEAEPFIRQALDGSIKRFGDSEQDTLDCLYWYGQVLFSQNKTEEEQFVWHRLERGYKALFNLRMRASPMTIARWVKSLAPQERFLGANLAFRESGA